MSFKKIQRNIQATQAIERMRTKLDVLLDKNHYIPRNSKEVITIRTELEKYENAIVPEKTKYALPFDKDDKWDSVGYFSLGAICVITGIIGISKAGYSLFGFNGAFAGFFLGTSAGLAIGHFLPELGNTIAVGLQAMGNGIAKIVRNYRIKKIANGTKKRDFYSILSTLEQQMMRTALITKDAKELAETPARSELDEPTQMK